jgi:hypothetical protein
MQSLKGNHVSASRLSLITFMNGFWEAVFFLNYKIQ